MKIYRERIYNLKVRIKKVKSPFSRENLTRDRAILFGTTLTIVVLAFSMFTSTYSNLLNNSKMADANVYSYTLKADMTPNEEAASNYQKMARLWLQVSNEFRDGARSRAYSAIWCLFSLLTFIPTAVLLFEKGKRWRIPFSASIVLLGLALATYQFRLHLPLSDERLSTLPLMYHEFPRWDNIAEIIKEHIWLKDY